MPNILVFNLKKAHVALCLRKYHGDVITTTPVAMEDALLHFVKRTQGFESR